MGPVAVSLVLGASAPAKGDTGPRLIGGTIGRSYLHPADHLQGTVLGDRDTGLLFFLDSLGRVSQGIADGPGRTPYDDIDHLLHIVSIGLNPRVLTVLKHVRKIIGANSDVGADGAVVVNGDSVSLVNHATFIDRALVRGLLPGKSCLLVGAVTKWFFGGMTASAQGIVLPRFDFTSLCVLKRHTALH
jgi:hypothetical protein